MPKEDIGIAVFITHQGARHVNRRPEPQPVQDHRRRCRLLDHPVDLRRLAGRTARLGTHRRTRADHAGGESTATGRRPAEARAIEFCIEPSVIGGVRFEKGYAVTDMTVARQLELLQSRLVTR